jgi:hypothetical protein
VTKTLAIVALATVLGTGAVAAGSSAAQMTVSVTVVRSCAVDVQGGDITARLRLTCTAGAQSTVKVSQTLSQPPVAVAPGMLLTLNF